METQPQEKTKKCPKCGEEILASAKRCKHCQADIRNWFARHKIITGIIILFVIGIALGSGNKSDKKEPVKSNNETKQVETKSEAPKKEEKIYKMKEAVPVGNLVFIVGGVKEMNEISDGFTKRKAKGIYKLVFIGAHNNDKESRYIDTSMFKLIDDQGRKNDASIEGNMAVSMKTKGEADLFLKQLNPSLEATGIIIFDIPKDAKGLKLEVSGGMISTEKEIIDLESEAVTNSGENPASTEENK